MCNSVAQSTYSMLPYIITTAISRTYSSSETEARCPSVGLLLRKATALHPALFQGASLPQALLIPCSPPPLSPQVRLHAAGHHLCAGVHPGLQDYILWQLLVWALWLQPETLSGEAGGKGVLQGGSFAGGGSIKVERTAHGAKGVNPRWSSFLLCSWVCHTRNS